MSQPTQRSIVNSDALFAKAQQVMPGGVSSPVRAFKGVGGTPVFIKEGEGCLVTDLDGNRYIDYVASYGPLIAGHANERVVAALSKAIGRGTSFGLSTRGSRASVRSTRITASCRAGGRRSSPRWPPRTAAT